MAWPVIAAAVAGAAINAYTAQQEGKKARKAARKLSEKQTAAQEEADRQNLLASAYGLGTPVQGTAAYQTHGMQGKDPSLAALQGLMQGAGLGMQFGQLNPTQAPTAGMDPYAGASPTAQQAMMSTEAAMPLAAPTYMPSAQPVGQGYIPDYAGSPYDVYQPGGFMQAPVGGM